MSETIDFFRAITNDVVIKDQEILKFIKWGQGNIEQALNYYYRKKEKENKSQPTPNSSSHQAHHQSLIIPNVFDKMGKAMVKQKRTEEFIAQVRDQYQLPVRGRRSSKEKVEKVEADEEMDIQFAEADYLPEIFCNLDQFQRLHNNLKQQLEEPQQRSQRHNQTQNKPKKEQKSKKSKSLSHSLDQLPQKTNNTPKQSQFDIVMDEPEIYIGDAILQGFAIKFENNLTIPEGAPLEFRYFLQQQGKKKKHFKSKKSQKNMNMRLVHGCSEFGRLKDEQVRIFLPLIVHKMLRLEMEAFFIPTRMDYYTQLKVKVHVYLLRKAITEPVVETFEGQSQVVVSIYKPVSQQIIGLFDRLQLPIRTWPLIKKISKHKNNNFQNNSNLKKEVTTEYQQERRKLQQKEKRQRSDPFFKIIQKNINEMFKAKNQTSNPFTPKPKQQEKSAVHKRVLQLKTIEEDKYSQLVDLYEEDLEPYQPSKNFISHLYNYQALALAWMMRREGQHLDNSLEEEIHPLWTEFEVRQSKCRLFLNQLTSQISIKPPMSRSKCLGGILADEMGLGKTVMMAALIATTNNKSKKSKNGSNLVVVPLTLLSQWQSEIKRHTKDVRVLIYYSEDRKKHMNDLHAYDVVITTYGTISHQFSKGFHVSKGGIYKFKWDRIILDEAHYIKGRIIQTAKAVYEIEGINRWCLTGTPIQNNLSDLFSLVHFIRYTPWSEYECWSKYINKPVEMGDENVFDVLRTILKRVFLRRTKQSRDHEGKPIVELPNRASSIQILQMSEKERQFYDGIYESSRSTIEQLEKQGILETKYMQVLEILMRLRQICCHPILYKSISKFAKDTSSFESQLRKFIKKRESVLEQAEERYYEPLLEGQQEQRVEVTDGKGVSQTYIREVLNKIEKEQLQNCLVCLGEVEEPVVTACLHIFCRTCAVRQIEQCGICSACRKRLSREDFMFLPRENRFNQNLFDADKYFRSTKLIALFQRLQRLKPDDKVVIFSQFLGMMDLIEHDLKLQKISYVRMEGSTSHKQRTRIVEAFQKDPTLQVFLVSLKTAGVGLNLVAANKVFLMDPWWNPGVEEQAIQRVHRIGQKRDVEIVRFVIDKSIEMRMVELNTSKKQLSQKVLSQEGGATESRVQKLKYLMEKY